MISPVGSNKELLTKIVEKDISSQRDNNTNKNKGKSRYKVSLRPGLAAKVECSEACPNYIQSSYKIQKNICQTRLKTIKKPNKTNQA
jgi:hypothetical protein